MAALSCLFTRFESDVTISFSGVILSGRKNFTNK